MGKTYNRRSFLKNSAAGTAVVAGYSATAHGYQANETLNVGCLGTGGRCQRLMKSLATIPGVRIAAVCDVWDVRLEQARKLADPKAFSTKIFEEVLERSDIDAVLIGSPDHWHVAMTIAACEAGKDVYVEKPLTHSPSEGAAVIEAQNHNRRIVQVGMQQRSMPQVQKAREILRSGQLGKIHKVHLTWNRNTARARRSLPEIDPGSVDWRRFLGSAPDQPFDPYRFRRWRWFWDFGGGILTDLMVHHIDIANWFLDLENPSRAVTVGDHFTAAGLWETPDTIQTLIRYPDQDVQVYFGPNLTRIQISCIIRARLVVTREPGMKTLPKQIWLLSITYALMLSGASVIILTAGVVGSRIAPSPDLATLPVALAILGVACMTLPVGLLMARLGRKKVS